jgi:hypothetical protein
VRRKCGMWIAERGLRNGRHEKQKSKVENRSAPVPSILKSKAHSAFSAPRREVQELLAIFIASGRTAKSRRWHPIPQSAFRIPHFLYAGPPKDTKSSRSSKSKMVCMSSRSGASFWTVLLRNSRPSLSEGLRRSWNWLQDAISKSER